MGRQTYTQAYETAKRDLIENLGKREQLDRKIAKLRQTLKALGELCGSDPEEIDKLLLREGFAVEGKPGFTDAIRRLLRLQPTGLSPTEIRDGLLKSSVGLGQVNLLSSIHTVLRRLVEAGEIEKLGDARFRARRI